MFKKYLLPIISITFVLSAVLVFAQTQDSYFVFKKNLSFGIKDSDVRALRNLLNADIDTQIGTSTGTDLSIFDEGVRKALTKFQRKYGVTPATGSVGPITRVALNGFLKKNTLNLGDNPIVFKFGFIGSGEGLIEKSQAGSSTASFDIMDTTEGPTRDFVVLWMSTSTMNKCKSISSPEVLTWNGDNKPTIGLEKVTIGSRTATTSLSIICNNASSSVSASLLIDRTAAFNANTGQATSSYDITFYVDNNQVSYTGTSTTHKLTWSAGAKNSCVGTSNPILNRWNNNSKYTSGVETVVLPVGTTTVYLRCVNPSGGSGTRLVTFYISSTTDQFPPIEDNGPEKIKIKAPKTGDNVETGSKWYPIIYTVKSGFATSTRINVRLIGVSNSSNNNVWIGQFNMGSDYSPTNCGLAQSDTDRTLLCDEEGLKFRVPSKTLTGTYKIKFIDVNNSNNVWFSGSFNLKKGKVATTTATSTQDTSVSLRILSPKAGDSFVKKEPFELKFKSVSGFSPAKKLELWLIGDSNGYQYRLGSFRFGDIAVDCLEDYRNATLSCNGQTVKAKLSSVVKAGTYKFKVISPSDKKSWIVSPVYVVPARSNTNATSTATVSESSGSNKVLDFFRKMFR